MNTRARRLAGALRDERGSSIIEGLLALGLVLAAFATAVQLLALAQARTVALAAAQAGARAAAEGGTQSGLASAEAVLTASGGVGRSLTASIDEQPETVTVSVSGPAPSLFPLGIPLPEVSVEASAPQESYPTDEQAVGP